MAQGIGERGKKWNIPNSITILRIFGTMFLMFLQPFSVSFFVIYTITGATDVLDGMIARKTGTTSEFGARLDSIADLFFFAVVLLRITPSLSSKLPMEIWYVVVFVFVLRFLSYIVAAIKFRKFASVHTYMNKLTGVAVFTVPYMMCLPVMVPMCWGICLIAALASLEEMFIHLRRKEHQADTESILKRKKH